MLSSAAQLNHALQRTEAGGGAVPEFQLDLASLSR
jgi:hypothetical protein